MSRPNPGHLRAGTFVAGADGIVYCEYCLKPTEQCEAWRWKQTSHPAVVASRQQVRP